jgi:hypothetical protein
MPTGWAIRQTILDHETHRQIDDAVGIMTARRRQIRQIVVEVLAALRAVMLRIGDDDIPRTPQVEIA